MSKQEYDELLELARRWRNRANRLGWVTERAESEAVGLYDAANSLVMYLQTKARVK
jgi:hypothetical protein